MVLGDTVQAKPVHTEPAHFDNVAIEVPKQLEQTELLQPRQEKSQIVLASTKPNPTHVGNGLPPTGSHQDWMIAAGIQPSDFVYVEYIVAHESSWRPDAVNPSSGACSLVQALPCSKIGGNWRDPVTALKWQKQYVTSRYGGYEKAYAFWVKNKWY